VVAVGKDEGIDFDFNRIELTPNSMDAHLLIWLAGKEDIQDAVVESLFRAYFIEGRDISNKPTLLNVVSEAGLKRDRAEAVLSSEEGMEALKEAGELSRRHGIDGVPFFVVNDQITLSGAQQPDTFHEAFRQAVGST
jgi:predicted DsbA family dithiol-disulfide isomerase